MKLSKIIFFLVLVFFVSGCKSEKVKISGHVTFQGNPIEKGKISFDSTDGNAQGASSEIIDGYYELTIKQVNGNASMIVRIWGFKNTGKKITAPIGSPGITKENELLDLIQMFIPPEHNSTSKKIVNVTQGKDNVFDFDLQSSSKSRQK